MTKGRGTYILLLFILIIGLWSSDACFGELMIYPHRGFSEVSLETGSKSVNPYTDVTFEVVFERPDGSKVTAGGFYDGEGIFKARAYCDMIGRWRWISSSNTKDLDKKSGVFEVKPSSLKGKLRLHKKDRRQLAYDNGQWFLHIGDTGYRYLTQTEPKWREYIDQAAKMGATKIRTWFCQGRSDVQILFSNERKELNLAYWQEIDRRLRYAFERHPDIIFELIPYGEDTAELHRYDRNDEGAKLIARYAQARFSALPNIYWCISNDREIVTGGKLTGRKVLRETINKIGKDMVAREPWGTLITNHQSRWTDGRSVPGGKQRLTAPDGGDWIALLRSERSQGAKGPLRIHSENPRYFTDGTGKAVFLTGSHTWANFQERGVEDQTPDFDYERYLDFMQTMGHNFMRMWRWEHAQWMQFVPGDTLIRYKPMSYMRTGPGKAIDGKPKFDLTRFNQIYFDRLRERVVAAGQQGIYVSVMLFQGFSVEQKGTKGLDPKKGNAWDGHPYNLNNNINGIDGDINDDGEGDETHTLENPKITRLQEAYIRKVIDALNDLDNVLWEISNESHTGSIEWHYHMIRFIKKYEMRKPKQHPVGMTSSPINNPPLFGGPADWISPNGKHYLSDPPDTKGSKVIIVDNDHINPWNSDPDWVWKNFMRGNHFILMDHYMDFRIGSPKSPDPKHDPARRAMGLARKLSERMDLISMTPQRDLVSSGYCLANPGREYLVYQSRERHKRITLILKPGKYSVEWINPSNGKSFKLQDYQSKTGTNTFVPPFNGSAILHLRKK